MTVFFYHVHVYRTREIMILRICLKPTSSPISMILRRKAQHSEQPPPIRITGDRP